MSLTVSSCSIYLNMESNLDYPDLLLWSQFLCFCVETPVPTEFVSLQSTNLYAFRAITNTLHFTELWLAQICSVAA